MGATRRRRICLGRRDELHGRSPRMAGMGSEGGLSKPPRGVRERRQGQRPHAVSPICLLLRRRHRSLPLSSVGLDALLGVRVSRRRPLTQACRPRGPVCQRAWPPRAHATSRVGITSLRRVRRLGPRPSPARCRFLFEKSAAHTHSEARHRARIRKRRDAPRAAHLASDAPKVLARARNPRPGPALIGRQHMRRLPHPQPGVQRCQDHRPRGLRAGQVVGVARPARRGVWWPVHYACVFAEWRASTHDRGNFEGKTGGELSDLSARARSFALCAAQFESSAAPLRRNALISCRATGTFPAMLL